MRTINELVEEVKSREKQELIDAVYKHGEAVDDGFEVRFEGDDKPVVAGYVGEEPCDVVVAAVLVTHSGYVYLEGCDKNNVFSRYKDIEASDIFAGHLDFITQSIG
jgi:hypothetical protein